MLVAEHLTWLATRRADDEGCDFSAAPLYHWARRQPRRLRNQARRKP